MDAFFLEGFEELQCEILLRKGLSARQGHPAAVTEKGKIPFELVYRLFHRHLPAIVGQSAGGTGIDRGIPVVGNIPVKSDFAVLQGHRPILTLMHTAETADAARIKIYHMPPYVDALGILAPDAPQGTSLEKDGGADAVTVMGREAANIKHVSFRLVQSDSLRPF